MDMFDRVSMIRTSTIRDAEKGEGKREREKGRGRMRLRCSGLAWRGRARLVAVHMINRAGKRQAATLRIFFCRRVAQKGLESIAFGMRKQSLAVGFAVARVYENDFTPREPLCQILLFFWCALARANNTATRSWLAHSADYLSPVINQDRRFRYTVEDELTRRIAYAQHSFDTAKRASTGNTLWFPKPRLADVSIMRKHALTLIIILRRQFLV